MSLIYKTLFEVKLMHEFFLTEKDGKTIFDSAAQEDRLSFLLGEYSIDREAINRDLQFEFPEEFKSKYNGYNLKLLPSYSGFKIAIRVNQKVLSDNTLLYKPMIPLPDDLNIYILLSKKNNSIESYTNSKINRSIPSLYFFSNDNLLDPKTFPFLVNNIPAKKTGYSYEQGELAFDAGVIQENYKDNTGGDKWNPVTGKAFANENDRLLLPLKFNYSFVNSANITQAQFVVKDKNGTEMKKISINTTETLQKTSLDFSPEPNKPDVLSIPETFSFSDYIFSLEVTGSNGYSDTRKIIFSDAFYNKASWGVINIRTAGSNTEFNLLADDGFLKKRRRPSGVWDDAPVFEIPIKSRFSYWRYINDKGNELELIPDLTGYLFKEDKILLTQKPRSVSKSYFFLPKEGSTDTKYLPNPVNYDLKKDNKDRLYLDIMVPESELFPIII